MKCVIKRAVALCPLLLGSVVATPATSAVTFLYANASAEAYLVMADFLYSKDQYRTANSFKTYKNKFSALPPVATLNQAGIGTSSASSSTVFSLPTTSSGTVTFAQTGTMTVNDPQKREAFTDVNGDFQYGFTIDKTYTLFFDYTSTIIGAQAGGTPYRQTFYLEDQYQSPTSTVELPNGTTTGRYVLDAGTYYLDIRGMNFSDFKTGIGSNTASLNSTFAFNLQQGVVQATSPTPEPATWAMMVIGFGVVGVGVRRRRSHTSCATSQVLP